MRVIIAVATLFAAPLLATPAFAETLAGPYSAVVLRVLDGDTIEARVHTWLSQDTTTRVRLVGIDAPELKGQCQSETDAGKAARDHLAGLLPAASPVALTDVQPDKYGGRVVASVRLPNGHDASKAMMAAGHARLAARGRLSWCSPP